MSDNYYDYYDEYWDYYDDYDTYSDFVKDRYGISLPEYPSLSNYRVPKTETYNANILKEKVDKYTTTYTFTVKDNPNSFKIETYKNLVNKNKLIYNFKFTLNYNYNEYKLYFNTTTEKNAKITPKIAKNELNVNKLSVDELEKEFDDNREKIVEKLTNIINELFPSIVNYSNNSRDYNYDDYLSDWSYDL